MSKKLGTSPFSAGEMVAQKYRLIRQLGEGGMGVVWLAVNESTGGELALKLIVRPEPELRQRLLREARTCCSIRHRNVIQIHDVGQTDTGDPFLVMELLSGETLADMLARRRRLSQEEAATIGRDIARALAAAHEKEVVHRDLKPANVFLHNEPGGDGAVVKVLDFGVSKSLVFSDGMRTVPGGAVGSPMYMSPEQTKADPTVDGRSDIWSLGVVLFEMLVGQKLFTGEGVEIVQKVLAADIPLVSRKVRKIDPALDRLVASCLSRRREERPWPASELAKQLEAFAAPVGRAPLPTLSEPSGLDDLAAPAGGRVGSLTVTGGEAASRAGSSGHGRTALEPTKPLRQDRGSVERSSPGHGNTALRPSPPDPPYTESRQSSPVHESAAPRQPVDPDSGPRASGGRVRGHTPTRTAPDVAGSPASVDPRGGTIPIFEPVPMAQPPGDDEDSKATLPIERAPAAAKADRPSYTFRGTLRLSGSPVDAQPERAAGSEEQPSAASNASISATAPVVAPTSNFPDGPAAASQGAKRRRGRFSLLVAPIVALAAFVVVAVVFLLRGDPSPTNPSPTSPPELVPVPVSSAPALSSTPFASASSPASVPSSQPSSGSSAVPTKAPTAKPNDKPEPPLIITTMPQELEPPGSKPPSTVTTSSPKPPTTSTPKPPATSAPKLKPKCGPFDLPRDPRCDVYNPDKL
jgi:serine/threonine-protein kinase